MTGGSGAPTISRELSELLAELQGKLTVPVPAAGRVLGLGRDAAYGAAARGEIPTLRFGRRLVVPVQALLEMLGLSD